MMNSNRARNLYLLRGIFGTQQEISRKISIGNSSLYNKLTRQCQGEIPITDHEASFYAASLNLPDDWLDRDNLQLLRLSKSEYELVKLLLGEIRLFRDTCK